MRKKSKPIWVIVFYLVFCVIPVLGQTGIDSLLHELEKASSRKEQVELYLELSKVTTDSKASLQYIQKALTGLSAIDEPYLSAQVFQGAGSSYIKANLPDSALWYLEQSLLLNEGLQDSKFKAKSWYCMALAFDKKYSFDSSIIYYKKARDLSDSINDTSNSAYYNLCLGNLEITRGNNAAALKHLMIASEYFDQPEKIDSAWISLNSLAIVHDEMGLYSEAIGYYLKAYSIIESSSNNKAKLILANNLGTIYHKLGKTEEAKDFYAQGLEIARTGDSSLDEAMILNNLSIVYVEEGDTLKALKELRKAHAIQLKDEASCDMVYSYEGLGEVMTWQNKYDSAEYFYNEAMNWAKKCEMLGSQVSVYRNMALLALKRKRNKAAKHLLEKSLQIGSKYGMTSENMETSKELFRYYHGINDLKNALKYHIVFNDLKDSLFNAQSTEKIARMTSEYDFRREIESLKYKKIADEMRLNDELRQKEAEQNSILVVLILTTLLAATLGRSYYLAQNHNKKLTALNEEKNTLMGVVAHDLRSPLNNIKGLISLVKMEKTSLTAEQRHYFHLVDDTMERMRDMIDRVLDVSVVEDMKVNLNLKKVDLGQSINFVAGNFELLASKKNIEIHNDLDLEKHFIFADYNYLLQVIENLLSNAIKFSESGKNIFINVFQEEGIETMIIRDEGPGISEEDQKRLFTKFQKLSAKPTDNEQSTGLGLSIVKKFVDAMEAEISCESKVGHGTSFIIKFKIAVEKEQA